jgi:hypothetical protein
MNIIDIKLKNRERGMTQKPSVPPKASVALPPPIIASVQPGAQVKVDAVKIYTVDQRLHVFWQFADVGDFFAALDVAWRSVMFPPQQQQQQQNASNYYQNPPPQQQQNAPAANQYAPPPPPTQ